MFSHESTKKKENTNSSCTDFFLNKNMLSFQHTQTASTCVSDFHEFVLTVLKKTKKGKFVTLNSFKLLFKFNTDLNFSHNIIDSCMNFDEIFLKVSNRYVSLKTKVTRVNYSSYASKTSRKGITRRPYLEKKYLQKRTD